MKDMLPEGLIEDEKHGIILSPEVFRRLLNDPIIEKALNELDPARKRNKEFDEYLNKRVKMDYLMSHQSK